jgi:plasmid replication initiation protein
MVEIVAHSSSTLHNFVPGILTRPKRKSGGVIFSVEEAREYALALFQAIAETAREDVLAETLRRKKREDRLQALGFEDLSNEQRKEQLAKNVALLDWPKE